MITDSQWLQVLTACGVCDLTAYPWLNAFAEHVQADKFSSGAREIPDFVGQMLHETQLLERLEEDLNYGANRLTVVWPHRFPTIESATPFAHNPRALANRVYGNRMGNVHPDDGWLYRGRGIPMITGLDNYALIAHLLGLPLVTLPNLLSTPDGALRCGVLWWEKKIPDSAIGNVEQVTRGVQGATLGLDDREKLTDKARRALALLPPS